ncbi:CMGC/CDK/CRK7 protein kinase, partial [Phytophthora nicotianae P1976]
MAPPPPSGPPAPSSPPPPPPSHSAASPASSASKRPSKSATKARRTARTPPGVPLPTPDKPKSNHSSSFSSPLPPCPEDPPAPPPPSCTPPKYRPLEENDDDTRSVESADEPAEPQSFPTPPPPPSPPVTSPLGTPPPPPPPPFSPPNAKIAIDLSGALENAVQATEQTKMPPPPPKERQESEGEDGDDEQEETGSSTDLTALADASSSSVIASMRSAVREREIMATETVREEPTKKPRFYIGDIDNYSIIDKVGSGTYGEVFKCQHKVTKDIVALKKLRPDVEKNGFPVTSIREMKILKYLKHPNILELKEIVSSSAPPKEGKRPPLYFAFEYMEHDLSGLLNHPRVKFTRTQIQCYMRQLLTGIAFMHRNKIIHRDIKASNLLLNNQGMLKVGDFGLSRFWNEVNAKAGRYTNKVVTLWYRPPELLMGSTSYDFSVDVWSIGCIFGELLLGKPILQGKTEIEQLQLIFGLCGMPTEETWPGFFKLPGAESFQMDDKFVCPLLSRRMQSIYSKSYCSLTLPSASQPQKPWTTTTSGVYKHANREICRSLVCHLRMNINPRSVTTKRWPQQQQRTEATRRTATSIGICVNEASVADIARGTTTTVAEATTAARIVADLTALIAPTATTTTEIVTAIVAVVGVESVITTGTAETENASANVTSRKPSIVIIIQRTRAHKGSKFPFDCSV